MLLVASFGQGSQHICQSGAGSMGTYKVAQRYTYNWFTRYPRSLFTHTYEHIRHLGGKNDAKGKMKKSKSALPPVPKEVKMEDTGGFVAMVIGLMAQRKVSDEMGTIGRLFVN